MSYFKAKMHQIRFLLGLRPRSRWGELTALPQTPELDIRGPTSKGREGRNDGREGQGMGKMEGRGLTSKARGRGGREESGGKGRR